MMTTPVLLLLFDRLVAPRLDARGDRRTGDTFDEHRKIVVLGYGRSGQIFTRMLRAQGFDMTLIDDDPAQIELVRRFGVKVFYGDGARVDLLHSAGVADAELVVIAVAGRDRILTIARNLRRHFPHVAIAARAVDRGHAHDLMALGVEVFVRETFLSALNLGAQVLVKLGRPPEEADRLARAFERHDHQLLVDCFEVRSDELAYMGMLRNSMNLLDDAMRSDAMAKPIDTDDLKRTE